MSENRELLKIVVVGHVDHGKSTVVGRLLHDTGSIAEGRIQRVRDNCREKGKPFEYAYLLDAFEEEQKQGITIDTTQIQFFTEKRDYVIIDAPGHKEFLKNMVSGAANAEAAFLIIDAGEGIAEQSRRHAYIVSLLGIRKVYVIVNKMDLTGYSQQVFQDIRTGMSEFFRSLDVTPLDFIPVSAFYGKNILEKADALSWYQGPTLIEALDSIPRDGELTDKPLRFPIQDVYKFDHRRIVAGRIESGSLKVGDEVVISPSGKVTRVRSIEHWAPRDAASSIGAGQSVGITLEDEFFNKRGEVITHRDSRPLTGNYFRVNLFWLGRQNLHEGKKYKLKLSTQETEVTVAAVQRVLDASTLQTLEGGEVKTNDVAEVLLETKDKVCFDRFADNQATGRFVLVDGYDVAGGGIIVAADDAQQSDTRFRDGDIAVTVNLFDELFISLNGQKLSAAKAHATDYNPGDIIPLKGDTYTYPETFDVLDLEQASVVLVREAEVRSIVPLKDYVWDYNPVLTPRGFGVRILGQKDIERLVRQYGSVRQDQDEETELANRWFDAFAYRELRFV